MKIFEISKGVSIYTRSNPNGFGYELNKKTFLEASPSGYDRYRHENLFRTYDSDLLIEQYNKIVESKEIPETWPDTSEEIPPIRVLRYESKHHNYHYEVSTPEKLEKAARKILKDEFEYNGYYPPDEPKNLSGISSIEELDLIGIEGLKNITKNKFEEYQKKLVEFNYLYKEWNNLQNVLNDKGNLDDVLSALGTYEVGRWDIIDLDEI